ncbi:MAG: HEAT repeat domain-containing protein [Planctomycetota bacterium]|nr:MAG: HEAT repeat domain-containing protein [Planctomycetota bacterium]
MRKSAFILINLVLVCGLNSPIWALGTEDFGNKPLREVEYQDWRGIMPCINHPNRVYHRWVNGGEGFYFSGNTQTLNDYLRKFAVLDASIREVAIRPGPATTWTFDGNTVTYDWQLELTGGFLKYLTTLDKGSNIWSKWPTVTVYIGKDIELEKIGIPEGVEVIELRDLKKRHREALLSKDKTVRGWGAGRLARLDPYDKQSLESVAALLNDKDDWVRLNAAGALSVFGRKAQSILPSLRECLKTDNEELRKRVEQTIQAIENAKDTTDAEKEHGILLAEITKFVQSLRDEEQ